MGSENKNLNRFPRSFVEDNFDILESTSQQLGSVLNDILIFSGNNQMRDLFGEIRFSLEEFCAEMGHDRTKLQRKLTQEQLTELFGKEKPNYRWVLFLSFPKFSEQCENLKLKSSRSSVF